MPGNGRRFKSGGDAAIGEDPAAGTIPSCFSRKKGQRRIWACLYKQFGAKLGIQGKLQFELSRGIRRPLFLFIEYCLFKDSEEEGSALSLNLPRLLSPLSFLFHIMASHAITLLKLPCYFVKLDKEILAVFAFQGSRKSLLIASLGVRKQYRRLGMGAFILRQIENTARHLHKKYLEVDVLMKNVPARRLYMRGGFTFVQHNRRRLIMRGTKMLVHPLGVKFRNKEQFSF